jgi:hypothetical protein
LRGYGLLPDEQTHIEGEASPVCLSNFWVLVRSCHCIS